MSFAFNDTTNLNGLVQLYEKEIGANQGDVSGSTTRLKEFAAATREAWDSFLALALPASGTWQYDDSNQTDYPIITTNLVANQRDYNFTTDGSSNLILDIYKVFVADSAGTFTEILPVDVNTDNDGEQNAIPPSGRLYTSNLSSFTDGKNATGTPTRYDKLANGIFLDPIPSYNYTNGLKVYINREPSYFVSTDTTKKAGVPGVLQAYFYLKPAADYLRRDASPRYAVTQNEVLKMEQRIIDQFSRRIKDEPSRMRAGYQDNR